MWLVDQAVNVRGVYIDREGLDACKHIIEQATIKYTKELREITGGAVQTAGQLTRIKDFFVKEGFLTTFLKTGTV